MPGDLRSRIRGLQTHKEQIELAQPGSRVAVNLTGVHPDQLHRGQVLTLPNQLRGSRRVDVRLRVLPASPLPLQHNMAITFHSGAAETAARLRLLETDEAAPGASVWAQIELQQPLALARGDRFIIRRPSPSATVGGGVVVDPAPRRRHRRRQPAVFARLATLLQGDPADLLLTTIAQRGPLATSQALAAVDLPAGVTQAALADLLARGAVIRLDPADAASALVTPGGWQALQTRLQEVLQAYHAANPLRLGMPREEAKSRLQPRQGWSARLFNAIVARALAAGERARGGRKPRLT